MYLSRPVHRIRDDPLDGEVVALRVEPTDGDARTALESRVESLGGSLEHEPQFGDIIVSLAEPAVSDLYELDGIERIGAVDTLGYWFFIHACGIGVPRGEWYQPFSVFSVEVVYGPSSFPHRAIRIRRTARRPRDCDSPHGVPDGTVSVLADLGGVPLPVAYLLFLAGTAVQYWRGKLSGARTVLLVGMCLTWLSYALLQVMQSGTVPTGAPLNCALNALAVVVLVVGMAAVGWW